MDTHALTDAVRQEARRLGFDVCRFASVDQAPHASFFELWLAAGRAGEMTYLARNGDRRRDPRQLVAEGAPSPQTLIVLGANYHELDLPRTLADDPSRGVIASYAWGADYHEIMRPLLYELDAFVRLQTGRATPGACLVDTGPVLERDWAHRAGLGFTGKNCCTIRPGAGSWFFLATILVPERLIADPAPTPLRASSVTPHQVLAGLPADDVYGAWNLADISGVAGAAQRPVGCGRCTRCLDACPTDAFVGPFHLDPQRCISYWTIEARGAIPPALRSGFGNRIFGCDICQEVCPYNARLPRRTPLLEGLRAQLQRMAPPLLEGFGQGSPYWLDQKAFSEHFRTSPVKRARRHGMLRNVCVALGNWAAPETIPALCAALEDPHPLPRAHAAWALGRVAARHRHADAMEALVNAQGRETDDTVRAEIAAALG